MKKSLMVILSIGISTQALAEEYIVSLNDKHYKNAIIVNPKKSVSTGIETLLVSEGYPFSTLILNGSFVNDGSRHYFSGSSYGEYTAIVDSTKLKISLPTESAPDWDKTLDLSISINGIEDSTCVVPTSGSVYALYSCEIELDNIKKDDVIKFTGVGTGKYTIFGHVLVSDEKLNIISID
jgi:hypothetical protein